MKKTVALIGVFLFVFAVVAGSVQAQTATPTNTNTPTVTPTNTHTPTFTHTPTIVNDGAFQSTSNSAGTPVGQSTPSNHTLTTCTAPCFSQWKPVGGDTLAVLEASGTLALELYCRSTDNVNDAGTIVSLVGPTGNVVTSVTDSGTYRIDGNTAAGGNGTPAPDRSSEKQCRVKVTTCTSCVFGAYFPKS
jgi:hypothetical protein